jgi:SulP family sulfate permease
MSATSTWARESGAGAAAAAVMLPQAMAFGVALFAVAGLGAGPGALAGIVGAAALCLGSGAMRGTSGLISGPTGPTLVLLSGAAATLVATGLDEGALLVGLTLTLIATGFFQLAVGLSGGGKLIKYIPHPVVSGFMTGSAILMIKSQAGPLDFREVPAAFSDWRLVPLLVAALTFAVMTFVPRLMPRIPAPLLGLFGGTLIFHGLLFFAPGPPPSSWLVGQLPSLSLPSISFRGLDFGALPWATMLASAAALALLASLDTLLTSLIADVTTQTRHDARLELMGQGLGQMIGGVFGGMAGAGTTGATVVAVKSGGRRLAPLAAGVALLLLSLVGGPVGRLLPVSVLAGIIVHVAVSMIDVDIFAWLRRRRNRLDGIIALGVTTVTVAWDLMIAVGFGVAIAAALFLRALVTSPVIHRRSTVTQRPSLRRRPRAEKELLATHGERIVLCELRGNLFFGTADKLFDELAEDLNRPIWLILHLRRVQNVDLTGTRILAQIGERLAQNGGELVFCEVHRGVGLGRKVRKTLKKIIASDALPRMKTFVGADEALEYAENRLLKSEGHPPRSRRQEVPLAQHDLCGELLPTEVDSLQEVLERKTFKKGATIFEAGDEADELFLVEKGEVEVLLPTTRHHHKRLALYEGGTHFGELAFLSPGPRAARAVAKSDVRIAVLGQEAFARLTRRHPEASQALLLALGRTQVVQLRWSAEEIHRLAQW